MDLRLRLRYRLGLRLWWCTAEASVAGTVEKVDDMFELRYGEVSDFGAVEVVNVVVVVVSCGRIVRRERRRGLRRKDTNEMFHAL